MDSAQVVAASSGALFQNLTSYLSGTLANITTAIHGSNEYLSEALGLPANVVACSGLAALVAVPLTMSRYGGWSGFPSQTSPYSSMGGGPPPVTDDDFSYITSQDLDDPLLRSSLAADGDHARSRSANPPNPEDDVLLIKNKGVTYPAHFPAYAIGDGKLRVEDVRERVGLMMDLSERGTRRIKLLYKGRQLKSDSAPVRDYGVKNKSELMAVLPEMDDGSSPSEEEMVIVNPGAQADGKSRRRKRKNHRSSKKSGADGESASSPRDSTSTFDPPRSPEPSAAAANSGPMKKLDDIALQFTTKWLPLCDKYVAAPPSDAKKREEEHRRLSESILQQILLKLDAVETDGINEVRTKRKELVKTVQETLRALDAAKDRR